MDEIYKKHRPKTLKGVLGQTAAISSLESFIKANKIPHSILFTGPSGCGKTTLARIVKDVLQCGPQDYFEINSADFKGIDMVRDIRKHVNMMPFSGPTRVWVIDEAHKLTNDAQNALLRMLEDTPKHTYFMLCTTDPQKLLKAIHTRCSEVKLSPLSPQEQTKLLQRVINREGWEVTEDVIEEIIEASEGSARKALVILDQVARLEGTSAQMQAIQATTLNKDVAFSLARALISRAKWPEVAGILRKLKEEDAEGVRYCVLGYARTCLVGGDKGPNMGICPRAFMIIDIFSDNFYDSKQAGLAAACWEVVNAK